MYRIENTAAAIKNLQRLLGLNESGKYDEKTKKSVIGVQKSYSLPLSGITDYETFKAILKEYKSDVNKLWRSNYLFSPKFPFREGDIGDNVARINNAMTIALRSYRYDGVIPNGAYLGRDSLKGANFLMNIFGTEAKDEIDVPFMNRLLIELEGIEIKSKFGL